MDSHSIARLDLSRRNIGAAAVDRDMAVQHQLARLPARVGKPEPVHHVVEAHLEDTQQVLAGYAGLALGSHEVLVELALQDAVDIARLLLLFELQAELALLAAAAIAG